MFAVTRSAKSGSEVLFGLDGGDCFFQLTYDVERGICANLMINGESYVSLGE